MHQKPLIRNLLSKCCGQRLQPLAPAASSAAPVAVAGSGPGSAAERRQPLSPAGRAPLLSPSVPSWEPVRLNRGFVPQRRQEAPPASDNVIMSIIILYIIHVMDIASFALFCLVSVASLTLSNLATYGSRQRRRTIHCVQPTAVSGGKLLRAIAPRRALCNPSWQTQGTCLLIQSPQSFWDQLAAVRAT